MQAQIRKLLSSWRTVGVETAALEQAVRSTIGDTAYEDAGGYPAFSSAVGDLEVTGELVPVRSAPANGRFPSLPARFRRTVQEKAAPSDLLHRLHPSIDTAWYRTHPDELMTDASSLMALDAYLRSRPALESCAINERSLLVFEDEKFLRSPEGEAFLRRVQVPLERLDVFIPPYPLVYEKYRVDTIGEILVVENMDTFHSLRLCFRQREPVIASRPVDLLIWGEGNKITGSLPQIDLILGMGSDPVISYWGDIDPEGLAILHRLSTLYPDRKIVPAVPLYAALLDRNRSRPWLRTWSNELEECLECFPPAVGASICTLAAGGRWLPQEGLTYPDFLSGRWADGLADLRRLG